MYKLEITKEDSDSIYWVGGRYCWSDILISLGYATEGTHEIPESDAWEIASAVEMDTQGGHDWFPCLDHTSQLYAALCDFVNSIV